jgi:RNA polymerase sigma factor (sigma-70 family)
LPEALLPQKNKKLLSMSSNQNDNALLKELYDLYHKRLYDFAECFIKDPDDVIQEVFTQIFLKKEEINFTQGDKVRGLLFTMAYRRCMDAIRTDMSRKRVHSEFADLFHPNDPSILQQLELIAEWRAKWAFIIAESKKLPDAERRAFEAVVLKGIEVEDYARQNGISPQTVRNLKNRALKKIRERAKKRNLDILLIITLLLH